MGDGIPRIIQNFLNFPGTLIDFHSHGQRSCSAMDSITYKLLNLINKYFYGLYRSNAHYYFSIYDNVSC